MPRDVSKYRHPDGTVLPSVTEVLDDARLIDFSMVDPILLEEARVRGSAVHTWIELVTVHPDSIRGVDPPSVIRPFVSAWEKWRAECGFEIKQAETAVVDPQYLYGGTFDCLGYLPLRKKRALVDYKARYGLTPEIGLQLAAYRAAIPPFLADPAEPIERYALLLRKDGSYRFELHANRTDISKFRYALGNFHTRHEYGLVSITRIRALARARDEAGELAVWAQQQNS